MNREELSNHEEDEIQQEKKYTFKEPESPIINISSKKNPRTYKLVAKLILRKFGKLELRSLGNAASSVVVLAHSLVRNRYATYDKIQSDITNLEDINNESGTRKGIQFVIKLKKSEYFDQITKDLIQVKIKNINFSHYSSFQLLIIQLPTLYVKMEFFYDYLLIAQKLKKQAQNMKQSQNKHQ